jgi:hypothetical protein
VEISGPNDLLVNLIPWHQQADEKARQIGVSILLSLHFSAETVID